MTTYPVWWWTGRREDGQNVAEVLAVEPYRGKYRDAFTHVLRLRAPNTKSGWLEMAVRLE